MGDLDTSLSCGLSRKEGGGKVSRFRTGQSGSFQWALVDRGYPWLSDTWPWGDVGRWIVWPPVGEPNNGCGWGVGSGAAGLHLKKPVMDELFPISRN